MAKTLTKPVELAALKRWQKIETADGHKLTRMSHGYVNSVTGRHVAFEDIELPATVL
jgi:hypothetical protein